MKILKFSSAKCRPCIALNDFLPIWNKGNLPIEEISLSGDYAEVKKLMETYGFKFVPSMVVLNDKGEVVDKACGTSDISLMFKRLNS